MTEAEFNQGIGRVKQILEDAEAILKETAAKMAEFEDEHLIGLGDDVPEVFPGTMAALDALSIRSAA